MKQGALFLAALLAITSCGGPRQGAVEEPALRPNEVSDFRQLYAQNCSGCHGVNGQGGLTVALGNPVYLAIADDATIRRITANGVRGTAMPAFAQRAGGYLTDAQIDVLVRGIRVRWATLDKVNPPAYTALGPGDAAHGQNVFVTFCSSCHGPDGRSGKGGSIVDSSYLALVSDQHLRTVTITGMPALGAPDWRGDLTGKPLSDADVTDVVAWLASQRLPLTAQAHPSALNSRGGSQ
ncbi:MAG TPA: c-type cytochrome [Bryobacteraceae bacterium]|nr:c-type cytochrome [Bryobacteraceae bacterium]